MYLQGLLPQGLGVSTKPVEPEQLLRTISSLSTAIADLVKLP
ncbi:hypothetical protein [Scytonema sp. PCC 10023]